MSNGMQLISILLFALSLLLLVGAVLFVALWHRTYRKTSLVQLLREDIGHIGVSAIVAYPETPAPLLALLEEEYPHSEAVIITDLQSESSSFAELLRRYRLVRVNHSHLEGVRALYRSRHRAFRRIVMVDLPMEYREQASDVGRAVASYENHLCLEGESIVERDSLTYCANVVASQPQADRISLRSFVGAEAHLENSAMPDAEGVVRLRSKTPLAWRKGHIVATLTAMLLPSAMVVISYLLQSRLMLLSAVVVAAALALFLYVSTMSATKKSLFARLDTVLQNFYRFWAERFATPGVSRTLGTLLRPSREREQSRPARCHAVVEPTLSRRPRRRP